MRKRARTAIVVALAWTPFVAFYLLSALRFGEGPAAALEIAVISTSGAALVGWIAWRYTGRAPWPDRLQPSFYLSHLGLALALSLLWTVSDSIPEAIRRGSNPVTVAFRSPAVGWQLIMGVWMYGLVAGVSYALRTRDRLREQREVAARAEALAARAQLDALRARVNPHFLFNALHSLSTLIRTDQAAAEGAIERLGNLLRYAVAERSSEYATIGEEWAFTRDYLDIERLRLQEALEVHVDLPPETLPCIVPPFTLQPLVENAVQHGIPDPTNGAEIWISARIDGDDLVLTVRDDGPGADPALVESSSRLGLRALRHRLAAAGGEQHIRTGAGRGFEIVVRFPQDDF